MGWLSGWSYRRAITITEQSGSTLTDYQVRIELNSSNFDFSKANADGSDIRFTKDDGETLLAYWIEKWDSSNEQAVVWVKVPSIPAGGSTTIYMYYGNPSAVSESDGEAVFEFFDDFDTADYTVIRGSSSQVSVSDGWLRIDATSGVDSTYNDIIVELNKQASISGDFIVESKVTIDTKEAYAVMLETDGQGYSGQWYGGNNKNTGYIIRWDGWSSKSVLVYDTHYSASTGSTQILRWDRVGSELRLWDTDLSQVILTASSSTYTSFSKVAIRVYDGGIWQTDWVRVRKYAEQEPSVSVGSEETPPIPVKVWDGSSWVDVKAVKVWDGSSWVDAKAIYVWDGSSWVKL